MFLILYFGDACMVHCICCIWYLTSLEGPFTIFAPNDAAFAALPKDTYDRLTKDKCMLKSVLQFHVLNGNLFSSEMRNDLMATTLNMNMKVRVNIYNKVSMYHYWYSFNYICACLHYCTPRYSWNIAKVGVKHQSINCTIDAI